MLTDLAYFTGAKTHWRKRNQHEPGPVLKEDHFEVFLTQFCAISLNTALDYKKPLAKRLRMLPLIRRVANSTDDLTVTVWIYNDDETEHVVRCLSMFVPFFLIIRL